MFGINAEEEDLLLNIVSELTRKKRLNSKRARSKRARSKRAARRY